MARTLAIPEGERASVHRSYGDALRTWNTTRTVTLRVANRAFVDRTMALEPSFLALTRDAYGAEARAVDFVHAFEPARLEVNEWVASQTERRIQDLLPQGSVDSTTRVVLANAVYFNGAWKTRFDPARTAPMPFTLAGGGSASVDMMQMRARFAYAHHADGLRILEMPYEGDELRMVWLLPETADGIAELEARVDTASLARWRSETRAVDVEVGIPRFRMEPPTTQLGLLLARMGMPRAFDGRADFSGIAGAPGDLQISDVFHRAFIDVNERGTEAAAATAVVMGRGMGPRPEPARFYADHPFLFALVDQRTDTVLFFGRVSDPR